MAGSAQVHVRLRAEGGAQDLDENSTTTVVQFDPSLPFSAVGEYLKQKLDLDNGANDMEQPQTLILYVEKFCPCLDEEIGVLLEAYGTKSVKGRELVVSYAQKEMYG